MLLRWEQKDLAERASVSLPSIKRLETIPGPLKAHAGTIHALCAAFEKAGIMFIASGDYTGPGGPGVRLREE
ncbi:MAG: transcriptional regulator [Rhodospirillaceae bacterium]